MVLQVVVLLKVTAHVIRKFRHTDDVGVAFVAEVGILIHVDGLGQTGFPVVEIQEGVSPAGDHLFRGIDQAVILLGSGERGGDEQDFHIGALRQPVAVVQQIPDGLLLNAVQFCVIVILPDLNIVHHPGKGGVDHLTHVSILLRDGLPVAQVDVIVPASVIFQEREIIGRLIQRFCVIAVGIAIVFQCLADCRVAVPGPVHRIGDPADSGIRHRIRYFQDVPDFYDNHFRLLGLQRFVDDRLLQNDRLGGRIQIETGDAGFSPGHVG